ncbi:DUF2971 domain-containing protein [Lacipirellula limnantheis]|uniref:DUF2971 domain-containing protein n=1 Tax=Lacipirellula limnantheis TaxID=2528024 RepID=A0A517TRH0_9BACT|nr:DUF2971 domain-containing protein [Lacipirellula limnantheis]QDT70970.1 hypothetical protein I41_01250 [Lacipirellula limnantheis]
MESNSYPPNPPQYLHKYRCTDANTLSLLASDSLYLARIESFNDPFEFVNPIAKLKASSAADPTATFAKLERQYRTENVHSSVRVCAFAEPCDDILLWGHYADCHKGFCIRYEFANDPVIPSLLFPVEYYAALPDYTKGFRDTMEMVRVSALAKYDVWSYEKEWRIIGHVAEAKAATEEQFVWYRPTAIAGIIFGLRMPIPHKALIRKVLQGHSHVKYYQAFKKHDAFAMEIREIGTAVTISAVARPSAQASQPPIGDAH